MICFLHRGPGQGQTGDAAVVLGRKVKYAKRSKDIEFILWTLNGKGIEKVLVLARDEHPVRLHTSASYEH